MCEVNTARWPRYKTWIKHLRTCFHNSLAVIVIGISDNFELVGTFFFSRRKEHAERCTSSWRVDFKKYVLQYFKYSMNLYWGWLVWFDWLIERVHGPGCSQNRLQIHCEWMYVSCNVLYILQSIYSMSYRIDQILRFKISVSWSVCQVAFMSSASASLQQLAWEKAKLFKLLHKCLKPNNIDKHYRCSWAIFYCLMSSIEILACCFSWNAHN